MSTISSASAPLTVGGRPLDTSADRFAELEPANGLLGDAEALQATMDDRGYLFFRGLIDPEIVPAIASSMS